MDFEASTLDQEPSQTRSHIDTQGTSLRLHTAAPNQAACYATGERRYSSKRTRKDDDGQDESVQNLAADVVLVTEEVNVQFGDDRPSSSPGSYDSWDLRTIVLQGLDNNIVWYVPLYQWLWES